MEDRILILAAGGMLAFALLMLLIISIAAKKERTARGDDDGAFYSRLSLLSIRVDVLEKQVQELSGRLNTAEEALSEVKQTVGELPLEELNAQADFERRLSESLDSISNYSVAVAMGQRGDGA